MKMLIMMWSTLLKRRKSRKFQKNRSSN